MTTTLLRQTPSGLDGYLELNSVVREQEREDLRDETAIPHLYGLQRWLRDRVGRDLGRGVVRGGQRHQAQIRFGFRRMADGVAVRDDRPSRLSTAEAPYRAVIRVSEGVCEFTT